LAFAVEGATTVLKVAHPAVSGGLELTYGTGGTYGGFGRIIEQKWQNTTALRRYWERKTGQNYFICSMYR